MSGRSGGGGGGGGRGRGRGRGRDSGRGQPSPSYRRRGGGDGTGRGARAPVSYPPQEMASTQPTPSTPQQVASTQPTPSTPPQQVTSTQPTPSLVGPSTSYGTESLTGEVSEKLTLEPSPNLPPSTSKAIRFPQRPDFGTLGEKCLVRANHFLVNVANSDLHQYDVAIRPDVTSKKVCRDIMKNLVDKFKESHLGRRSPAYDGRKSLYTAGRLPFDSKEFVVTLTDEGSSRRERQFTVAIKLASKPDLHILKEFLRGRQFECPYETIQVLDVVLRDNASRSYTVVGRSFFDTKLGQKGELGNGIEYWMGYYQSLRPTQMGLSLNIDVSARSFYEPILVTEFVAKHFRYTNPSRPLSDQDRIKVKKALKGVRVECSHTGYAKTCRIVGVSREPISQLTFTQDDNTNVSVVQYFRKKYNIVLKNTSFPALQCGSEAKPVYLPMELCKIVEGQRYTKKLNDQQVRALLRATCKRPREREDTIRNMMRINNFQGDRLVANEFGIKVENDQALIQARILPPPMLKYHDSGQERTVKPGCGAWNMINKKMVNGERVDFWTCLNFSLESHRDLPNRFCLELVKMCNSKGMVFRQTACIPIRSARPERVEQALLDVSRESKGQNIQLQLLLIILPDQTGSYGKIKRICETELGIVSQCCQPRQAGKLQKQYFENLALKINVKVGGRNSVLDDAIQKRLPLVTDYPTIIFGADVTHPQPGEDASSSIAAVVASMDWPEVTKYRGIVSAQYHREEIIQDLYKQHQDPQKGLVHGGMIRELLVAFYKSTGHKPYRIIFYRDGVSEGQFSQVLLHEMDAIRKACASLQEGYMPRVTFVVVQKRHHTRLFPADRQTDRSGNIIPGTVVDTIICHPTEFDFYLNSHAGIQGTSKPTHYHVLYDENNFSANNLQMLTNKLCYTYARCTRSVSIVPPAYYAHLAAFRARYYVEDDASDSGSTSGGQKGKEKKSEVRPLPTIKDNVKNVMFYC